MTFVLASQFHVYFVGLLRDCEFFANLRLKLQAVLTAAQRDGGGNQEARIDLVFIDGR